MAVKVISLREVLSAKEIAAVKKCFPGKEVNFVVNHPKDYIEHAEMCRMEPKPIVVLKDRPIPSLAMEEGVTHVVIMPDGQVMELLPLEPKFKPFVPRE